MPEEFWDATTGKPKEAEAFKTLAELSELKKGLEERAAKIPEKAEGYELKLPDSVKLPANAKLNPEDPLYRMGREVAHRAGMTQESFQDLVGVYVQHEIAQRSAIEAKRVAEMTALGPTATERVTNVQNALLTRLNGNEELAQAVSMSLTSAKAVEAMEALLGSNGSFSQSGRSGDGNAKTPPGFAEMSPMQKMQAIDELNARKA